jgi:Zn-dependent alcohol dehydrogenase
MRAAVLREVGRRLTIDSVDIARSGAPEVQTCTAPAASARPDPHFIDGSYPHALHPTRFPASKPHDLQTMCEGRGLAP